MPLSWLERNTVKGVISAASYSTLCRRVCWA